MLKNQLLVDGSEEVEAPAAVEVPLGPSERESTRRRSDPGRNTGTCLEAAKQRFKSAEQRPKGEASPRPGQHVQSASAMRAGANDVCHHFLWKLHRFVPFGLHSFCVHLSETSVNWNVEAESEMRPCELGR